MAPKPTYMRQRTSRKTVFSRRVTVVMSLQKDEISSQKDKLFEERSTQLAALVLLQHSNLEFKDH